MDAIDFSTIAMTDDPIFVPGHVHDEACSVRPVEDQHYHNEYCYLSEAIWQVARAAGLLPETGGLADGIERMAKGDREKDPALALSMLHMAATHDAREIAAVPGGPEAIAAVEAELIRLSSTEEEPWFAVTNAGDAADGLPPRPSAADLEGPAGPFGDNALRSLNRDAHALSVALIDVCGRLGLLVDLAGVERFDNDRVVL